MYLRQAHDLDLHIKNNIDMAAITRIWKVDTKSPIKHRTVLVDRGNEDLATDEEAVLFVPADDTWTVVQVWENVVFIDEDGNCCICVLTAC